MTYKVNQPGRSVAVGVVSTQVLGQNPNRSWALIVNNSDTNIFIALNNNPVLNSGLRLNSEGGAITLGPDTDMPFDGAVYGISSIAGKTLTVTEVNKEPDLSPDLG